MEMMNQVGFRFAPTPQELIINFLLNKILGKTWLVDDKIREINICSHEPESLPRLSKIKSDDLIWYFLCPKVYTSPRNTAIRRKTRCGFWKPTGKDRKIKDNRGIEIGMKKTLVYYEGNSSNGVRTPWKMHEHDITCLPYDQRTYFICKIFYTGQVGDITSDDNSSEPSHSLVFDSNNVIAINTPPQVEQSSEESLYSSHVNDLTMSSMNKQEDLPPSNVFDPNTFNGKNHPNIGEPSEENFYGSYENVFTLLMNEPEDLCPWDALDPNYTFSNDNNKP